MESLLTPQEEIVRSECCDFKVGWNLERDVCKACKILPELRREYLVCKKVCESLRKETVMDEEKDVTLVVEEPQVETPAVEPVETIKKAKKEPTALNDYGHRVGSKAAKIDAAFEAGGTIKGIAEQVGCPVGSVYVHKHALKQAGVAFKKEGKKFTIVGAESVAQPEETSEPTPAA